MYRYISIGSDEDYSESHNADEVDEALISFTALERKGTLNYINAQDFPWLTVMAVFGDSSRNYSAEISAPPPRINQIELVCWGDAAPDQDIKYTELAQKIADKLKWKLLEIG
jgi:hypothetical protein